MHLEAPEILAGYMAFNIIEFSYRPAFYGFYSGHGMVAKKWMSFERRDAIFESGFA